VGLSGFAKGRPRLPLREARKGSPSAASMCKLPSLEDHRSCELLNHWSRHCGKDSSGSCCFLRKIRTLQRVLKRAEVDLWGQCKKKKMKKKKKKKEKEVDFTRHVACT